MEIPPAGLPEKTPPALEAAFTVDSPARDAAVDVVRDGEEGCGGPPGKQDPLPASCSTRSSAGPAAWRSPAPTPASARAGSTRPARPPRPGWTRCARPAATTGPAC